MKIMCRSSPSLLPSVRRRSSTSPLSLQVDFFISLSLVSRESSARQDALAQLSCHSADSHILSPRGAMSFAGVQVFGDGAQQNCHGACCDPRQAWTADYPDVSALFLTIIFAFELLCVWPCVAAQSRAAYK